MDLMRARVALRERPLLDTYDLAIRFCAAHAGVYAKVSLAVLVPCFALSWAAGKYVGWIFGWTVTVVLTSFAGAPFVALASKLVFADAASTREALGIGLRNLPALVGIRLLQLMALGASLILAGLPWLWLGTILLFAVEVRVLEQSGVGAAFGRAQRIANAHFSDAILTMLMLAVVPPCVAMLADVAGREVLQSVLEVKPPPSMFREGGSWLALLGWWSTVPLCQTARFFVYLDIRTRTEGWDIQTRFAAIAARAEEEKQEQAGLVAARAVRRRATVGALLALLAFSAVTSFAPPAGAVLDPAHAQSDVDASMREKAWSFCKDPRPPLSSEARSLCKHATEIPDCAGFAGECAKVLAPPPPPPSPPSWLSKLFPHALSLPAFLGTAAQVIVWALVAALVLAILIPIVRAILRIKRDPPKPAATERTLAYEEASAIELPTMTDEEALLARAGDLARAGRFAEALQLYLAASLRALDKRGAVRIARDRTNGEYVRGCGDAMAKPALRDIVREVDRAQFGGVAPSAEAVTWAAQRAVAIVRALPVMVLALVLLAGALGCGGSTSKGARLPKPGDDPAGGELFRDVLVRQGVDLAPLETALASLPIPKAGERVPAVIVDLEKTDMDDDTREHLVEWVDGGGVLVLAGNPYEWPKQFGASTSLSTSSPTKITVRRLLARSTSATEEEEEDDAPPSSSAIYARTNEHGVLAANTGLSFAGGYERAAWFDDGTLYAAVITHGKGFVVGIATSELLRNAGLAHPGNGAAMVSILTSADRLEMRMADAEDGVSPPATPIAALIRAGLGLALLHAIAAGLVLFLAVGMRLARPRETPPPRRRAFAEHVQAVGALYARTNSAPYALTSFARFADERLHARMPRGATDVAAFLASRARMPLDECQRLWARAVQAKASAPPLGDELAVLRDLSAVYSAAMAQDRG